MLMQTLIFHSVTSHKLINVEYVRSDNRTDVYPIWTLEMQQSENDMELEIRIIMIGKRLAVEVVLDSHGCWWTTLDLSTVYPTEQEALARGWLLAAQAQ